jgi:hypothetical protein
MGAGASQGNHVMITPAGRRGASSRIVAALLRPCHLPLSLWFVATLFYGTAAGLLLHDDPKVAGTAMTAIWLAATWRGIRDLEPRTGARQDADSDTR